MLLAVDGHDIHEPSHLIAALLDAFPSYLWRRIGELGVVAGAPVATAVARGADDLAQRLEEMLLLPAAEQDDSPLSLVRDATGPVTATLIAMGVRQRERDAWETEAHPADVFGLYPASSSDLGEEAWRLHLQWGLEKAKAVAGVVPAGGKDARHPAVALFGVPEGDRDRVADAIVERGYRALLWRNPAALEQAASDRPALVLVDLRHLSAHDAIRLLRAEGIRVVATADYLDDLMLPGLLALGASEAMALDDVLARLDSLLPRIV